MRKLIPAVFALFAAGACHALGFGEMALHSALNQPLDATVDLVAVKPSERDSVEVRIPDAEMFERFGISRNPALDGVRVEIVDTSGGGDRLRVRLSTQRAVREPFLTLLLEADWDGGRALREYTVLLDPPTEAPTTPARAEAGKQQSPTRTTAADEPSPEAATARSPEPSPETRPARAEASERQRAPATPAADREYRRYGPVAADETLWSIAYELRPDPQISMDQMLLAIYQANPQAFEGNINRLNAGSMLIIPDADEIRAIDETVARQEIADQKRDYARSQRATRTAAASQPEPAADVTPSGEAPPPEDGELRLEPPTDEDGPAAAEAAPADPEGEAAAGEMIAENAAATARALAEAADAPEAAAEPEEGAQPADADGEASESEQGAADAFETVAEETGGESEADAGAPEQDAGVAGGDEAAEDREAADETAPAASTGDTPDETETAAVEEEPAAEEPTGEAVPVAAESVIPEGTAGLLTSRNVLLALAALLLVFATFVWLRRRQYKPVPADFSTQVASGAETATVPDMDMDRGDDEPPYPRAESAEEVLADADSYIEHELYDEALAALKVGMEQYPENPALRRKALEVHYAAGARDAFLAAARSYSPKSADDDPEWRAIVAMGRELAPDDPLFADAAPPDDERPHQATGEEAHGEFEDESDLERSFDSFFDEEETTKPGSAEETAGGDATPDLSWFEDAEREEGTSTPVEDETKPSEVPESDTKASGSTAPETPESGVAVGGEDFDLDLDWPEETTTEPEAGEDRPEAGETEERRDDANAAETGPPTLDIDLSEFDLGPEEDRREAEPEEGAQTPAVEGDEDEFADFDFDTLSLGDEERADTSGDTQEAGLDDAGATEEGSVEKPEFEASEGLSLGEHDQSGDQESAAGGEPEDTESMPSLDVDLDETGESPAATADEPPPESDAASGGDAESDEVTTKLDLARAYLDMGEPDMARSLLEEVKDQGNAEQRREAEELLERAG